MEFGQVDYGGGPVQNHAAHTSVDGLKGPRGKPDFRITLVAREAEVALAPAAPSTPGRSTDACGPEIRVRQGDLVEATLVNEDIDEGVTIHWHGVDVPNAEDVAGVTQNAVMPGRRYTYRFRAEQLGTVLVPLAPGLVRAGATGPLRRVRHRARQQPRRRSPTWPSSPTISQAPLRSAPTTVSSSVQSPRGRRSGSG